MIERIEELNETKEWSRDLLHPTEEGLCSLLALYGRTTSAGTIS